MTPSDRLWYALWLVAPAATAAAFVLTAFADTGAMLFELPRALAAAVGIVAFGQGALTMLLRRPAMAAGITLALAATVVDWRLALAAVGLFVARLYFRQRDWTFSPMRPVAVVVAVVFAVSISRAVSSEAFVLGDLIARPNGSGAADASAPDIFLIMLDGYPRSDTLASFGYHNDWFEAELEERGFLVSPGSRSNYPLTWLTLASMFNMSHLEDVPGLYPAASTYVGQIRALGQAINSGRVLEELEAHGYLTVSAGMPEAQGAVRNIDVYVDSGEIRAWERQVLQRTSLWGPLCEVVIIPQHRSLIESSFDAVEVVAESQSADPTFMFAHVMSPHTPIVFDSEGESAPDTGSKDCSSQFHIDTTRIGLTPEEFRAAMAEQVHHINTRTVEALDAIITARPDSVVIVFSDHGARYSASVEDEWFRSFFAARTPGHGDIFGVTARPIDIFPAIFDAYFNISTHRADDRAYTLARGIELPLLLEPWEPNE